MIQPAVDETLRGQLISMGFPDNRVVRALFVGGCQNAMAALTWLQEHEGDTDIDQPVLVPAASAASGAASPAANLPKTWKCVETGKLFNSMQGVELYAERTGRSNFEESTEQIKPLTEEEKQAKKNALKAKIARLKREREAKEKADKLERERRRRREGQHEGVMREEGRRIKMKYDSAARKREKEEIRKERERLRLELARDKYERAAVRPREGEEGGLFGFRQSFVCCVEKRNEGLSLSLS